MARRRRERENIGGSDKYKVLDLPEGITLYKPGTEEFDFRIDMLEWVATAKHPDVILDAKNSDIKDKIKPGDIVNTLTFHVHRNIGPEGKTVVCPKRTFGHKCPICEHQVEVAEENGNNWKANAVKALYPSERVAIYLVDLEGENTTQVYETGPSVFMEELEKAQARYEKKHGTMDYSSLTDGYTLEGYTSKKPLPSGGNYLQFGGFEFEKRKKQYGDKMYDELEPLENFLIVKSYEELSAILYGNDEEAPAPVEEDEPVRPRRVRRVEREDDEEEEDSLECPEGGVFGKDYMEFDECDDCDLRRKCKSEKRKPKHDLDENPL